MATKYVNELEKFKFVYQISEVNSRYLCIILLPHSSASMSSLHEEGLDISTSVFLKPENIIETSLCMSRVGIAEGPDCRPFALARW